MSDPKITRIMLIDDEALDQKMYRRIIERSGLVKEVIGFTRVSDAIDYFKYPNADPIDLIFLDIRMPELSGFDFLELAEPHLPKDHDVPVVMMLTTSMSEADRQRAETFVRVKSFLTKPLTQAHLQEALPLVAGVNS